MQSSPTGSRSSDRKLKPLPPDPFRHQNSAIAPWVPKEEGVDPFSHPFPHPSRMFSHSVCAPPLYPPDAGRGARSLGAVPFPHHWPARWRWSKIASAGRVGIRIVRAVPSPPVVGRRGNAPARPDSARNPKPIAEPATNFLGDLMNEKLRHRCRSSRCGSRLPQPVESSRLAFCCRGCHAQFYRKRCVVCEKDKANPNAIICGQRACRAELRKWPDLYHFSRRDGQSPTTCKVDARSAHSTGLKTRSVTRPAPLNLVGGHRLSNAIKIEADLAGYICAIEACLRRDEPGNSRPLSCRR